MCVLENNLPCFVSTIQVEAVMLEMSHLVWELYIRKKTKSNKNKYTFRYLHSEIVGMIDPCFILSSEFG